MSSGAKRALKTWGLKGREERQELGLGSRVGKQGGFRRPSRRKNLAKKMCIEHYFVPQI